MSEKEPLEPYDLPLSVDLPGVFAMSKGNPSDGQIDRWRFFGDRANFGPEEELCAAVLLRAVEDFVAIEIKEEYYRDAKKWLLDDSPGDYTFGEVCQYLHLDPGYIRKKVLAMAPTKRTFKFKIRAVVNPVKEAVRARIIEAPVGGHSPFARQLMGCLQARGNTF